MKYKQIQNHHFVGVSDVNRNCFHVTVTQSCSLFSMVKSRVSLPVSRLVLGALVSCFISLLFCMFSITGYLALSSCSGVDLKLSCAEMFVYWFLL